MFANAYTPAPFVSRPATRCERAGLPPTLDQDGFESFEYPTLPRHFPEHGYATVNAGQVHYPGENVMQAGRRTPARLRGG